MFVSQTMSCRFIERILSAIRTSTYSGKNLYILVLPPIHRGSKQFSLTNVNKKLHSMLIDGITKVDREYEYTIKGYYLYDTALNTWFYNRLTSIRNETDRRNFLNKACDRLGKNQLMFGIYDTSSYKVGLKIYLYDRDERILGKEPSSNLNWINWKYEKDVMNQISIQVRDLINRYFGR